MRMLAPSSHIQTALPGLEDAAKNGDPPNFDAASSLRRITQPLTNVKVYQHFVLCNNCFSSKLDTDSSQSQFVS